MSKFSDKLKMLIEESGLKIYKLAKEANLDRTTIHRSMTGERLPSLEFVKNLSNYLRLSPTEKIELFDLYSISKIGDTVYEQRKYIKEMIERIASIHTDGDNVLGKKALSVTGKINDENTIYQGQYIVNSLIRNVLEDEVVNNPSPKINITVPFKYSFLYDLLYQLYLGANGKINIKNIIRLRKTPLSLQYSNYNLEILSHVMPFAFSAGNGYQPYYFYDSYDSYGDISLLMPYYIITNTRVINLSADFKTAVLYNNQDIVNMHQEIFDNAIINSTPLTSQHVNCTDMLLSYLEATNNSGMITHVLEPQPCFSWYYTDNLMEQHLKQEIENRDAILKLLSHYYSGHKAYTRRPMSIFSIEGLNYFVNTGIIANLPTQFAIPFSVEERKRLLSKLKNDISNGIYEVYAANPSKFLIPICSIQIYNTKGMDLYSSNNNGTISSSLIEEKSIAEAFYDFFESIPDSDLVHNREETIRIIDSFTEQCNDLLCNNERPQSM